jgi:repressor LexA
MALVKSGRPGKEVKMGPRQRKKGLSERQIKILTVLDRFQREHGYPPSIREICENAGVSSTSVVNYYLEQLKEMGLIERDDRVSRGLRLLRPLTEVLPPSAVPKDLARQVKEAVEEIFRIPVIGRIFASEPVPVPTSDFAYMDPENMIEVARSMLPGREKSSDLYALEVRGDSMIDAMVYDGDIVIMRPSQGTPRNGEMVAVWLDDRDETTLKYFYLENGRVRLQPANPTMKPIYIDNPEVVQVQGKVVMVIRSMKTPLQ